MKDVWRRLRRPNVALAGILVIFGVSVLWIFYFAQANLLEEVMEEQSKVEAGLVKRTYELEQMEVLAKEGDVDVFLTRQNEFAAKAIGEADGLTQELIDDVVKEFRITGLWIIDRENKVRYGTSDDSEGMDATSFYSDFIDNDFVKHLDDLRENIGETWVSPFKLSHYGGGEYMKFAYTAIDIDNLSEVVIIETGASVEDLKVKRYGSDRFVSRHLLPSNISAVDIQTEDVGSIGPREAVKQVSPYQYQVKIIVDDIAGDSLVTVHMHYDTLEKEQHAFFLTFLIASVLMLFVFMTVFMMKDKKEYEDWVQESYQHRQGSGIDDETGL